MCLAQGHNAVTLVRLEPATARSRVKHSTTEPLERSGEHKNIQPGLLVICVLSKQYQSIQWASKTIPDLQIDQGY